MEDTEKTPTAGKGTQDFPKKHCGTCKKQNIYVFQTYKNCSDCREKNRLKGIAAAERKRQRQRVALAAAAMVTVTAAATAAIAAYEDMDITEDDLSDENQVAVMLTPTGGKKRKAPASLRELKGEERRAAMKQLKTSLENKVKSQPVKHAPVARNPTADATEYQTASGLYDALKQRNAKKLNFNGQHSIVTVPTIDDRKRIDLVANDLRKISRISFEYSQAVHTYDFANKGRVATSKCACLGYKKAESGKADAPPTTIRRHCAGKVIITAVSDPSHPFIPGQRISVRVEHPKAA